MKVLAEHSPTWRHPDDDPPPHGTKLMMISPWGIAQTGDWYAGAACWMPLPKLPQELQDRLKKEGRLK